MQRSKRFDMLNAMRPDDLSGNLFRSAPITISVIGLAGVLFVIAQLYSIAASVDPTEAHRRWGAVTLRASDQRVENSVVPKSQPELSGLFDLWNGEWWRIAVSPVHHLNIISLIFNGCAFWYLGRKLEPWMTPLGFLTFLWTAMMVSLLPEYLAGRSAVGLSGGVYAVFGVLLVLRRRTEAPVISEPVVLFGILWLFTGLLLRYLGGVPMATFAHFTGLGYGWVAGRIAFGPWNGHLPRFGFVMAHLLFIPAVWLSMHPFWNAKWHWYLAEHSLDVEQRIVHFKAVTNRDPSLRRPWRELAALHHHQGRDQLAWKTALRGLQSNPSDERTLILARQYWRSFEDRDSQNEALGSLAELFGESEFAWRRKLIPWRDLAWILLSEGEPASAWLVTVEAFAADKPDESDLSFARGIWRHLDPQERHDALGQLTELFGREQEAWRKQIFPEGIDESDLWILERPTPSVSPSEQFSLDQKIELPPAWDGSDQFAPRDLTAPPINPDAPFSAVLGERL